MKTKTYASIASAKRALDKAGLGAMNVNHVTVRNGPQIGRIQPTVYVHDRDDYQEVTARGFAAVVDPSQAAG